MELPFIHVHSRFSSAGLKARHISAHGNAMGWNEGEEMEG
jgi:hypothetical protein